MTKKIFSTPEFILVMSKGKIEEAEGLLDAYNRSYYCFHQHSLLDYFELRNVMESIRGRE